MDQQIQFFFEDDRRLTCAKTEVHLAYELCVTLTGYESIECHSAVAYRDEDGVEVSSCCINASATTTIIIALR